MNLQGKCIYALITGSSRGFGKSIADAFLSSVLTHRPRSVTLTLHGTPPSSTRITELRSKLMYKHPSQSTEVKINTFLQDFQYLTAWKAQSAISPTETPTHAYLFNNSGIHIPSALNILDVADLQKTMSVNLIAMCCMSQAFINTFKAPTILHIIHTTSLAALQPFPSWGAYCISKAAADMMHVVIGKEHPEIRVLQYAPGPLHTDMLDFIMADKRCDASLAQHFTKMRADKTLVAPDASAAKLIAILLDNNFNNSGHIDFYEI